VRFIGGVSIAESGLAYGELLDAPVIRSLILSGEAS
jgi:2-oxoglutarate ferredoxin oxidoreductase subunit alpha